MATSIWKKLADIAGFTTIRNSWDSMVNGDFGYGAALNTLPGFFADYVDNIKNWDNDSDISGGNSAVTVSNDVDKASKFGDLVNEDGSSNISGITSLEQLGPMLTEAVVGAIPEIQRQWSSAEALKERDWQTQMSNTAYQRSVADMKAAGINPILAYSQGGATSGIGASASAPSSSASLGSTLQGIGQIISTIMREDRMSDKDTQQAALASMKYQDSHSAQQASTDYVKTLNKINKLKLREAQEPKHRVGF